MLNLDEFHRGKQHTLGEQFVKKTIAQNVSVLHDSKALGTPKRTPAYQTQFCM